MTRVWRRDRDWSRATRLVGLGGQIPIIGHSIHPLTIGAGGGVEINKDGLSRKPMFNYKVAEGAGNLFQGD